MPSRGESSVECKKRINCNTKGMCSLVSPKQTISFTKKTPKQGISEPCRSKASNQNEGKSKGTDSLNGNEDNGDYFIWESSSSCVCVLDGITPDVTDPLPVGPLSIEQEKSLNVRGIEMNADCFISPTDYIEEKQKKYVWCPDLNYTDSDFEEDSKHIVCNEGEEVASVSDEECCIVAVSNKDSGEDRRATLSTRDSVTKENEIKPLCVRKDSNTCSVVLLKVPVQLSSKSGTDYMKRQEIKSPDETLFQQYVTRKGKKCLVCEVCERIFRHRYNLMKHMETHTGVQMKILKCSGSTEQHEKLYVNETSRNVGKSKGSNHNTDTKFVKKTRRKRRETRQRCPVCGAWVTAHTAGLHTANHLMGKTFICHLCQEGYYNCSKLNHHMRTHTDNNLSTYHSQWTKSFSKGSTVK